TDEPYVYRVVDASHFEVGATFALPSPPVEATQLHRGDAEQPESEGFWRHAAGPQVFLIDAAREKP
ncbi:MAG TPA: hypothetical protein DCY13_10600, partial [Verrucomicrobiales bacterium]|nr:hypothetical protein [Verrucomicrobiales bacterium]